MSQHPVDGICGLRHRGKYVKDAKDLIPWKVTDISIRPFDEMWSFNPSIHFDGEVYRCTLRCSDYAMPDGVTIRSSKSRPAGNQTKNAMVIFDPKTWTPIKIYKMQERDEYPRVPCANVGYEDMRIFKTDRGGLQGIAASLHLKRSAPTAAGGAQHQPPEQVLLSFDPEYNIVDARPIRGDWWSGTAQKNWVPFDHCAEPRFLYSIDRGTMFDDHGALSGDARVQPSAHARAVISQERVVPHDEPIQEEVAETPVPTRVQEAVEDRAARRPQPAHPDLRTRMRGGDANVRVVRTAMSGRRVVADTLASRPGSTSRYVGARGGEQARVLGTGRALPPKYPGLRGGTQLVRVGDDAWLGIGHEMMFKNSRKFYWHTWYVVDDRGRMKSASPPMKFASNGIEFAAGMAIDGDRVVVSFGVDDMECKLGETTLSAVMEILQKVKR